MYDYDDNAPMATMADAAREYHAQGLSCPFDCAACDSGWQAEAEGHYLPDLTHVAYLADGPVYAESLAEARDLARAEAARTGKSVAVARVR